nr:transposase-like protein [Biomphalaria glabrata]
MNEIKSADRHDKMIFRCPSHKSRKMSIRAGSILSRSPLSLSDFIFLLYFWSVSTPSRVAIEMLKHSSVTILKWYTSFEGVCTMYLKENSIQSGETRHSACDSQGQELKQKRNTLVFDGRNTKMKFCGENFEVEHVKKPLKIC